MEAAKIEDNPHDYRITVKVHGVQCQVISGVAKDIFTANFVQGELGWQKTADTLKTCEMIYGNSIKRCIGSNFVKVAEAEYLDKTKDLAERKSLSLKAVFDLLPLSLERTDKQNEYLSTMISNGLKTAYHEFRTRYDSCYFEMLRGNSRCVTGESEGQNVIIPQTRAHLENIEAMGQLVMFLPALYFTPFNNAGLSEADADQLMNSYLSEWKSLDQIIDIAQMISKSQNLDRSIFEFVESVIAENNKTFLEKVEPLLNSNFIFDPSLLVDEAQLNELLELKYRVEEKL